MEDKDFSDLSDKNQRKLSKNTQDFNSARGIRGDNGYNPDFLASAENSNLSNSKNSENEIFSQERSPWKNNVNSGGTHRSRNSLAKKGGLFKNIKKRKVASLLAVGGAGSLVVGIFGFLSVSLLPIHMTEILTEKLNSAASSLDKRFSKVLNFKSRYKVKGANCASGIICRFSTVTDRNIDNLKKAGFNVETSENTNLFGRKKIKKLSFTDSNGKNIDVSNKSSDIKKAINTNPEFRSALKKGYSGRFASFLDKSYNRFKKFFKNPLRKAPPNNKGKTAEEIYDDSLKKANGIVDPDPKESTNKKLDGDDDIPKKSKGEEQPSDQGTTKAKNAIKETAEEIGEVDNATRGVKYKKLSNKLGTALKSLNGIGIACGIHAGATLTYSAIKVTKIDILIQFGLNFLSYSSKIKSGQAIPEEVEAIGNQLVGITNSSNNNSKEEKSENVSKIKKAFNYFAETSSDNSKNIKSATDSQGYRAIAYNDNIKSLDSKARPYTVGVTHWFMDVLEFLTTGATGKIIRNFCKVVGWALIGAMVFSIGKGCLAGISGGIVGCFTGITTSLFESVSLWAAISTVATVAFDMFFKDRVIAYVAENLLGIMGGNFVNKKVVGEEAGNAISSGSSSLLSRNALAGGASTLSKEKAISAYIENEKTIALNAEEIRLAKSPLDITTRHTFLGSIVSSILPYSKSISSIGGFIPSILSTTSRSISNILPGASAADTAGFAANMNVCTDKTIKRTGAATDIFCNPYVGLDPSEAEKDPEEVIQTLINEKQLHDDDSKDNILDNVVKGSDLDKYIESCYNRKTPIGTVLSEDNDDTGSICNTSYNTGKVSNPSLFAVFLTDVRVQEGFDGDLKPESGSSSSDSSTSIAGNAKNSDCKAGDICWPIQGAHAGMISPGRWFSANHNGYDFGYGGVTDGTPVYNIADGEVISVGKKTIPGVSYTQTGYGPNLSGSTGGCNFRPGNYGGGEQFVLIKHNVNGRQFYSSYAHMKSNTKEVIDSVGKKISAGVKIGEVGNYGCSFGSHLHFSTQSQINGGWVDPSTYLGKLK